MTKHSIRCAIVAHNLRSGGGISVSTNIIRTLLHLHPEWSYLILAPDLADYHAIKPSDGAQIEFFRHRSQLQRLYFDEIRLPRRLRAYRADVILSLGNIPVRGCGIPQIVLMHNSNLLYPEVRIPNQPLGISLAYLATDIQLKRGLREVDVVFCQTETMRHRFQQRYQFPRPILILPNAVSTEVNTENVSTRLKPQDLSSRSFRLLYLTRYYAHKNIEAIVTCFDKYRRELQDVAVIITIAPDQHPNAPMLLATVNELGLSDAIVNVGPLRASELSAYYRAVDGILMPTLLESFSATYIEAMMYQKPILTSDRDFARETCGDAALYFDPISPEAMLEAILRFKNDHALRNTLVEAGVSQRQRLARTWEEVIRRAISDVAPLLPTLACS